MPQRIHFLGSIWASRTACGMLCQVWESKSPDWSQREEYVTCINCKRMMRGQ